MKFKFNNLLYIYFKNKSYRKKSNRLLKNISKVSSMKVKDFEFILFNVFFTKFALFAKILNLIKFTTSLLLINKIIFRF